MLLDFDTCHIPTKIKLTYGMVDDATFLLPVETSLVYFSLTSCSAMRPPNQSMRIPEYVVWTVLFGWPCFFGGNVQHVSSAWSPVY